MAGETLGERMARAEEWIEGHERRCAERQTAMGREIRDMKGVLSGLVKGAWGIALALLAWCAVQLYAKLDARASATPAAHEQIR